MFPLHSVPELSRYLYAVGPTQWNDKLLYADSFVLEQQPKITGILKVIITLCLLISLDHISTKYCSLFEYSSFGLEFAGFRFFAIFSFLFILKLEMKKETELFAFHSML